MGETLSREQLIPGIWDNDLNKHPLNEYFFTSKEGYQCEIKRNASYVYCGYVTLPKTHPFYYKHYDDIDSKIIVHGKLTYGRGGKFGFDCDHSSDGDISPADETMQQKDPKFPKIEPLYGNSHYWTFEETKAEVESMSKQFKKYES